MPSARLLLELCRYADDEQFEQIIGHLSEDRFDAIILSDIRANLQEDPEFSRRLDMEIKHFNKAKTRYEQQLGQFDQVMQELQKFQHRLLLSRHKNIREKIYYALEEWIAETPLANLGIFLENRDDILRLTQAEQNQHIEQIFSDLLEAAMLRHRNSGRVHRRRPEPVSGRSG